MNRDFRELREKVKDIGLMKASPWFFIAQIIHVILLDVAALWTLWYFGSGWIPWLVTASLLTVCQVSQLLFLPGEHQSTVYVRCKSAVLSICLMCTRTVNIVDNCK